MRWNEFAVRISIVVVCLLVHLTTAAAVAQQMRRLSLETYRDKMAGGWIGQMAGVGWGGPTEFKWKGEIIPLDKIPKWKPKMINQFHQDDIYVEMTFLRTLEVHGWDVSIRQAGIDFANSGYPLWHANRAGRDNSARGIAPPDSGHPQFNEHADDIDYQIEADYAGLIAPGMPNVAIELGEKFGRLMNYGDGLYGGQFVSGMYAEAFFEDDPMKIVEAGLKCIPPRASTPSAFAIRSSGTSRIPTTGRRPGRRSKPSIRTIRSIARLLRQGRLQYRCEDQRRLYRDGVALRPRGYGPDDYYLHAMRSGFGLQSGQLGRHPGDRDRAPEPAGEIHVGHRSEGQVQPHALHVPALVEVSEKLVGRRWCVPGDALKRMRGQGSAGDSGRRAEAEASWSNVGSRARRPAVATRRKKWLKLSRLPKSSRWFSVLAVSSAPPRDCAPRGGAMTAV